MRLKDQIESILRTKGPLSVLELSTELQRRAGIPALTSEDLDMKQRSCSVSEEERTAKRRKAIDDRHQLLVDMGYSVMGLYRFLSRSSDFIPVLQQVRKGDKAYMTIEKWMVLE